MNTSRLSRLTAGSHLLVCIYLAIAGLVAGCEGPEPKESVQLTEGVAIIIPTGWSQLDNGFANMVELVGVPQEKQADSMGTFPARLRVFVETRRSFDESVARLGEIAAEWEGPREYFLIDDWPALERRYDMPLPRRGQDAGKSQAIAPSITVAVAYDSTLVRIEGHLNPDSDRALLDTIARAGRSLQIDRKGESENSKKALERLRKKVSADRHTAERTGHAGGPPHLHFVRDFLRRELVTTYLFNDVPNTIDDPVLAVGGASEISVAVADDGQDVVVATNSGFSFSNDGGQTFNFGGGTPGPNNSVDGDPSVTWAQSDTFYYGYIAFPDGTAAWNNVQGCSTGISLRYPVVELVTAALFLALALRHGGGPMLPVWWAFSAALVAGAVIDFDHQIIPDEITLGGLAAALLLVPAAQVFSGTDFVSAMLRSLGGAMTGGGLFWAVGFCHARVSTALGREFAHWPGEGEPVPTPRSLDYWLWFPGVGLGDVKLLAMIGAVMGPMGVLWTIFAASLAGLVLGLGYAVVTRQWNAPFGFGPAIASGALLVALLPDAWL